LSINVLLVHPVVRESALPANLPLGLAYTSAALKREGISCHVLDLNMARLWTKDLGHLVRETLRVGKFTHVGISAIVTQFAHVEKLVGWIRGVDAQLPIIVGGPISALGEKLHKWLGVNVYQGESESLFGGYLRLEQYREDPVFSTLNPVDVNKIPWPDWKAFSHKYFQHPVGWLNKNKWRGGNPDKPMPNSMNMSWARGCPYKCSFCSCCSKDQPYRKRDPREIVREMVHLRRHFSVEYVHAADDNTVLDRGWLAEVCEQIRAEKALEGVTWGCAGRADNIDVGILEVMRDAGCRLVGVGIESGSQKVLDSYDKKTTVEDNERAILACKKVFGAACFTLMVGSPVEDDESVQETIDLCKRTGSRPEMVFHATPLPGSRLYERLENLGYDMGLEYVRGLGEMGEGIAFNMTDKPDAWLRAARGKILSETAGLESAL